MKAYTQRCHYRYDPMDFQLYAPFKSITKSDYDMNLASEDTLYYGTRK